MHSLSKIRKDEDSEVEECKEIGNARRLTESEEKGKNILLFKSLFDLQGVD